MLTVSYKPDEIPKPTILQTALFRVPVWAYNQVAGRVMKSSSKANPDEPLLQNGDITITRPEDHANQVIEDASAANPNAEARKRKAKSGKGKK